MSIKKYMRESIQWVDLTTEEQIAYEYADAYVDRGYSIEDAVTQGCFDMMNDIDEYGDDMDYEDPDPKKIKSFLMHKYKAPSGRSSKEPKKVLYVIKDSHGNQLSAPNESDIELWDRVAAMEARGKRGIGVVVYSIKPDKNESLNEVKDDKGVERYGINGKWWYFTTHGIGPGSVPKGIEILNIIDTPNGEYFCSDRVLNTSELKWYDIKERVPKGINNTKETDDYNYFESLRNHRMKVRNLDEATLNKQFRKDIKRRYKTNDSMNDINREKRADTMSMVKEKGLDKDPAFMKFVKGHMDDKYPMKPFKYKFPKHLEKHDSPFYVTYYQEYPIYEPAEGGYYYAGRDAVHSKGFETREEAMEYASELKNESGEDGWKSYSNGYMKKGKYVGEGERIVIENRNNYLSQEKGWEPYQ